jgi:nucleosome binding factor SPN SPT16 subunit
MKYKSHGAFLARTYFVDPTPQQNLLYSALLDAQLELIDKLRPGAKISDVVTSVRDAMLSKEGMPLDAKMTKNFGTGFGLRSSDKHLILSTKNETVVEDGMVFVASIGLSEIPLKDATNPSTAMAKLATYAILLSDTIVIRGSGNEVVTDKVSKEKSEVTDL